MSQPRSWTALTLALVGLLCCGAGCQNEPSTSGSRSGSASSSEATTSDPLAIAQEYTLCLRAHGLTDFPDMVVIGGFVTLPDDASGDAGAAELRDHPDTQRACQSILDRLPASAHKNSVLSAADREKLLALADCIRHHGVPEWPDPTSDGTFPLTGTPLETQLKSPRLLAAQRACRTFWDGSISIK